MGSIVIRSGDVAPGLYLVDELAVGIERVELQEEHSGSIGVLGVTVLGADDITFTAHLIDGGTFQAVTDRATYQQLEAELQP